MRNSRTSNYRFVHILLFSLVVLLIHLFFNATLPYDLYADEAQYWAWSKNPAWGYFSKPPMVAWVIAATTDLCGDGQFCIKLGSPILHFLTGLMVYFIGCKLFNSRVGFWSSIAYSTLPGITVSSYLISTDPALLFFWSVALYAFISALKGWHIKWWILLGISVGLGMLSKYTMILFFVSAGIYFLASKENRVYLVSFKFWLSVLVAAAVYWNNFVWNSENGFVSYMHTKDNANLGETFSLHPDKLFEFIGAQFGVFGPVFFSALLIFCTVMLPILCKRDTYKLLFSFTIPFLLVILGVSLLSRAHANWAAPIYIPGIIIVVSVLINNQSFLIKSSVVLHILAAIFFYHFHDFANLFGAELHATQDPFRRIVGTKEFAEKVKQEYTAQEDMTLLTTDRKTHAILLYYLRDENGNPPKIMRWNEDKNIDDHFELTSDMNKNLGENFLLVTNFGNIDFIADNFMFSQKASLITIPVYPDYNIEYDTYYLKGFMGY